MRKDSSGSGREVYYVWSGGGVERMHRELETSAPSSVPEPSFPVRPEDQRRFARLDLKLPILYKVLGHNASRIPSDVRPYLLAQSTNISPIGLCFTLSERFDPGTVLALTIHSPENRERFSAIGRVVWAQASELPGQFLTGVEFVVVDEDKPTRESHGRMQALVRDLDSQA